MKARHFAIELLVLVLTNLTRELIWHKCKSS